MKLLGEIFVNALERKHSDEALLESEECLNLATDSAGVGLWILDMHTHQMRVTPRFRELLLFASDEEVSYESLFKAIHPEDREAVRRALEQTLQTKERLRVEHRVLLPDGRIRWIGVRGRPYFKSSGETDKLMGVTIDITERKQIDKNLFDSRETLRAFTSRLLTIQEEERRRLARELHDDFTQRLAALAMDMSKLEISAKATKTKFAPKLKYVRDQIIKPELWMRPCFLTANAYRAIQQRKKPRFYAKSNSFWTKVHDAKAKKPKYLLKNRVPYPKFRYQAFCGYS